MQPMVQMPSGMKPRMKRSMPPGIPIMYPQQAGVGPPLQKQRRTDGLLSAERNDNADFQAVTQQKKNNGLPVVQNVQGGAPQQQPQSNNRVDPTIHLTDSITLSVRQPGNIKKHSNC